MFGGATVQVTDMRDPDREILFDGAIGPRMAVICAHAGSRGDGSTWEYESRYGHLVEEGRWHWFCGDFGARKTPS